MNESASAPSHDERHSVSKVYRHFRERVLPRFFRAIAVSLERTPSTYYNEIRAAAAHLARISLAKRACVEEYDKAVVAEEARQIAETGCVDATAVEQKLRGLRRRQNRLIERKTESNVRGAIEHLDRTTLDCFKWTCNHVGSVGELNPELPKPFHHESVDDERFALPDGVDFRMALGLQRRAQRAYEKAKQLDTDGAPGIERAYSEALRLHAAYFDEVYGHADSESEEHRLNKALKEWLDVEDELGYVEETETAAPVADEFGADESDDGDDGNADADDMPPITLDRADELYLKYCDQAARLFIKFEILRPGLLEFPLMRFTDFFIMMAYADEIECGSAIPRKNLFKTEIDPDAPATAEDAYDLADLYLDSAIGSLQFDLTEYYRVETAFYERMFGEPDAWANGGDEPKRLRETMNRAVEAQNAVVNPAREAAKLETPGAEACEDTRGLDEGTLDDIEKKWRMHINELILDHEDVRSAIAEAYEVAEAYYDSFDAFFETR